MKDGEEKNLLITRGT